MWEELPYRVTLLGVLASVMSVGVPFRLRAAASGEIISRRAEGYLFAFVLRLGGLGLWLATLHYLVHPASATWFRLPLPPSVRWLGAVSGLASTGLMYWTLASLGPNLTDTVVVRSQATLITHGPYRWVRHPFYLTAALLMGSVTLLTAQGLIAVTSLWVLVLLAVRTPKEEAHLEARFGEAYRNYAAVTGRFWPRWPRRPH